jgi:hypothetical protein
MSRHFVAASTQYLGKSVTPPVTDVPLTMAFWYRQASAVSMTGMSFSDSALVNKRFNVTVRNTQIIRINQHDNTTSGQADTTATGALNVWNHACGVFTSDNSRTVYLNGGNAVNNTTNVAGSMASMNEIYIGRLGGSVPSGYFNGDIAEAAVWNVALSAQEVASLAAGTNPRLIRPENLVLYYPLYGEASPETNLGLDGSAYNLTLTNTPTTEVHAPVSPPDY